MSVLAQGHEGAKARVAAATGEAGWASWLPLAVLPAAVLIFGSYLVPWAFMWGLAFSIYAGCKWLTWRRCRLRAKASRWRSAAYLLAWPGMDADSFLNPALRVEPTPWSNWLQGVATTGLGASLLWVVAPTIPANHPLLRGWTGMVGFVLMVHFGAFRLAALTWRSFGIDAEPIMQAPLRSTALSELWGRRWNVAFRRLAHDFIFAPAQPNLGTEWAGFLVFLVSGLIHDLLISLPSRGGWGLPTLYFVLQGLGASIERSRLGKRLGLRRGLPGWLYTAVVALGPLFWLYHPPFVLRVILPFMKAIGAL
jgi:hypothetical protein